MSNGIVRASDTMHALDTALRAASSLKAARGLLPDSLKSEGEIVAVILAGSELGIPPMAAIRGLQVVRGKVIISYDTMVGLLHRAGYRVEWPECSATCATLRLTSPEGTTHTETWDVERAKRAGLWGKGTWSQYPDTMLRARCVSSAARSFAGHVLAGCYLPDEGEEIASRGKRPAPVARVADAPRDEPVEHDADDAVYADDAPEDTAALAVEADIIRERAIDCATGEGSREERAASYRQIVADAERVGVSKAQVDAWVKAAREETAA